MQKKLFAEYAALREKMALLEEKETNLKAAILDGMVKEGEEKVETDYGRFVICSKKKWTYSKKVTKIEEDLKVQKFTEQEKGIAKVEESKYLAFSRPKDE